MTQRLPSALRPANPPAPLHGRQVPIDAVANALTRHRQVVLRGARGTGRTTVALAAAAHLDARWPAAVHWSCDAPDALRSLVAALDTTPRDAPVDATDGGEARLHRTLIDIADHHGLLVLLDDAECLGPVELASLLARIERWSRRALWLVVADTPHRLTSAERDVDLLPLEETQLERILDDLASSPPLDPDLRAELLRDAHGRPASLLTLWWQRHPRTPADASVERILAHVPGPVAPGVLPSLFSHASPERTRAAVAAGALHWDGDGLRFTPLEGPPPLTPDDHARVPAVLTVLADAKDTSTAIAAVGLAAATNHDAWAVAQCRTHGETWIESGWSGELAAALRHATATELVHWRRFAELERHGHADDGASLDELTTTWVGALYRVRHANAKGDPGAAEAFARVAIERAWDDRARARAQVVRARALHTLRRTDEAAEALAACAPGSPLTEVDRRLLTIDIALARGDSDAADEGLRALASFARSQPEVARLRATLGMVRTALVRQDLARAGELVAALLEARDARAEATTDGRTALEFAAYVQGVHGDLDAMRATVARLRPLLANFPVRLLFCDAFLETANLLQHPGAARSGLARLRARAEANGSAHATDVVSFCDQAALRLDLLHGVPLRVDSTVDAFAPTQDDLFAALVDYARARHGHAPLRPAPDAIVWPERDALRLLAHATHSLVRGAFDEAATASERAATVLERAPYLFPRIETLRVRLEIAQARGQRDALVRHGSELLRLSERANAPMLTEEAEWYRTLARAPRPDASVLLRAAGAATVNPILTRRARAHLGLAAALDAVDRRLVHGADGHRSEDGPRAVIASEVRHGDETPWVLDPSDMTIRRVAAAHVALGRQPVLWRVLVTLVEEGGEADKETLIERAWSIRDYHPLRDDNRLRVAVRKLRRALAPIGADADLQTAEDGYRLAGCWSLLAR